MVNYTNLGVNNTNGSIVGYKYFNFDKASDHLLTLHLNLIPEGVDGLITIMADRPWKSQGGTYVGFIQLKADMPSVPTEFVLEMPGISGIKGKHALYFTFLTPTTQGKSLCTLLDFVFE